MSWGNKLMFVFIAFAALMGTLVYKAVNTRFDLVSKDYYKDELRFQEQIDAAKNASEITAVEFAQNDSSVTFSFPENFKDTDLDAEIWFYCKADVNRDKKMVLQTNTVALSIAKKELFKGNFEVKIRWTAEGKNFYSSKNMTIL